MYRLEYVKKKKKTNLRRYGVLKGASDLKIWSRNEEFEKVWNFFHSWIRLFVMCEKQNTHKNSFIVPINGPKISKEQKVLTIIPNSALKETFKKFYDPTSDFQ